MAELYFYKSVQIAILVRYVNPHGIRFHLTVAHCNLDSLANFIIGVHLNPSLVSIAIVYCNQLVVSPIHNNCVVLLK